MTQVPLRNASGQVVAHALVDDEDAHVLGTWRWQLGNGYVSRQCKKRGRVYLHREILGLRKGDGRIVDHIDRNPLDNRQCNLRLVTHAENIQNRHDGSWALSGVRGVSWEKRRQKWRVHVTHNGRYVYGGQFADLDEAANRARELRGQLFRLATP